MRRKEMRYCTLLFIVACGEEREDVVSFDESVQIQEDSGNTEPEDETNEENNSPEGEHFLGDLTINSEETIKEFCSKYATLHGSLTIYSPDITTLSELQCLTKIYGSLTIYDTHLENLDGLENLTYIGDRLYIGNWKIGLTSSEKPNPYLVDISALQHLTYLGERYVIVADENTRVLCESGIVDLLDIWQDHFVPPLYSDCRYQNEDGESTVEPSSEPSDESSGEPSSEPSEEDHGSPTPPVAVCQVSTPQVAPPFEVASFDGSNSSYSSGSIIFYEWILISSPTGSDVALPFSNQAVVPNFMPDLAGEYVAQLTVTNDAGMTDSCSVTLEAVPTQNLWIEMYWTQSGDDMDLHLIAPNYDWQEYWQSDKDCYYGNCVINGLDWGATGYIGDDPLLELDDINDVGPEVSNVSEPEFSGAYTVVVHDSAGSVYQMSNDVTVNIYLSGSLIWSDTRSISGDDTCTPFAQVYWDTLVVAPINDGSVSCTPEETGSGGTGGSTGGIICNDTCTDGFGNLLYGAQDGVCGDGGPNDFTALLAGTASCTLGSDCTDCGPVTDMDGDGYAADPLGLALFSDCDDSNPSINAGVADTTIDGIDQNCDGIDGPTN